MPNSALGLLTTFGIGEEVTFGTAVTPTRWYEILNESLEKQSNILESNGLRSGGINLRRGSRRAISTKETSGSFQVEVPTTGFGLLLKHALGGTPTIAQQGGTIAYLQTHALGTNLGRFLTIQKVLRDGANAVVQQFTEVGVKITAVEFAVSTDGLLTATFDTNGRDENTSTAAAVPTYANNKAFSFAHVTTLTIGGTAAAKVNSASLKLTRPQKTDGWYLGGQGLKSEPVENDYPTVTGTLSAEFDSDNKTALYDRFNADTGVALVLTFEGDIIASTYKYTISFSVPDIRLRGETPKVGGSDVISINAPFEGAYDGSAAGITVTYTSTDTAV